MFFACSLRVLCVFRIMNCRGRRKEGHQARRQAQEGRAPDVPASPRAQGAEGRPLARSKDAKACCGKARVIESRPSESRVIVSRPFEPRSITSRDFEECIVQSRHSRPLVIESRPLKSCVVEPLKVVCRRAP